MKLIESQWSDALNELLAQIEQLEDVIEEAE